MPAQLACVSPLPQRRGLPMLSHLHGGGRRGRPWFWLAWMLRPVGRPPRRNRGARTLDVLGHRGDLLVMTLLHADKRS